MYSAVRQICKENASHELPVRLMLFALITTRNLCWRRAIIRDKMQALVGFHRGRHIAVASLTEMNKQIPVWEGFSYLFVEELLHLHHG